MSFKEVLVFAPAEERRAVAILRLSTVTLGYLRRFNAMSQNRQAVFGEGLWKE